MRARRLVGVLAAVVAGAAAGSAAAAGTAGVREFQVALDGKPIGTHRFAVGGDAAARTVDSEADFDVRFLGLHVYRYHHHATEQWQGDCLRALVASTDDDGKPSAVRAERAGDATRVSVDGRTRDEPACVMSFAYWNPAMLEQARLLNPQTGKLEAVRIEKQAAASIVVHGRTVEATPWRIAGAESPIEVWYTSDGEWVGLDSVVQGRHRLSYRLP